MAKTSFFNKLSVRLSINLAIIVLVVSLTNFPWISERLKLNLEWELAEKARVATSLFVETRFFPGGNDLNNGPIADWVRVADFKHRTVSATEQSINKLYKEKSWLFNEILFDTGQVESLPTATLALVEEFRKDPEVQEVWDIRTSAKEKMFYYFAPVRVEESCLSCHGSENTFASFEGIPTYTRDQLLGVIGLEMPMFAQNKMIKMELTLQMVFIVLMLTLIAFAVFIFVQRAVEQPLNKLILVAQKYGQGHLDSPFPKINAPAEIELMAEQWFAMTERLKGFYIDLEHQVKERTAKLKEANRTLEEQKRELEEANKIKSEFLASVSHELRTPLTSVIAFVELLLEGIGGPVNEQQRDYLEGALRGSHRLEDSINDLLDMAKIEAGNASLYPTYFSLEDLVLDLEKRLHSLILTKRIDFRIELATGPEKIYGDREKIERILLNLLSNAVKFTPVGGMVSIKAETNDQGLVVQVKDTGLGIKKEDQQYIFDAFRQVDGSTTRAYKGTGLGLAIAKKYVDLHGGFIWVESDLGKGSTFYFTIPKEGIETEVVKDGTEKDFGSG